jgi:hypothetical protein
MIEEWREVKGWPEYAISNLGRVKRVAPSRNGQAVVGAIRKPVNLSGYLAVTLSAAGKGRVLVLVHRLVALAFLGEPPHPDMEVNHKDADRQNARLDNLEWVSRSDNHRHAYREGYANAKGEANGYSKLTEAAVIDIRTRGRSDRGNWEELAAEHCVSFGTVRDVCTMRTWRHVRAA